MKYVSQFLIRFLARYIPALRPKAAAQKSVDTVLTSMNKAIADLATVASSRRADADGQVDVIRQAEERRTQALQEAERASAVRGKLQALISV